MDRRGFLKLGLAGVAVAAAPIWAAAQTHVVKAKHVKTMTYYVEVRIVSFGEGAFANAALPVWEQAYENQERERRLNALFARRKAA